MKSKINLLEQLKPLPHFSKNTIYQLGIQLGLTETTLNTYVSRFLKYKEILQLKKGLYVSSDFFEKNHGNISYIFYLANILRQPSYVSSWAALQYYNLATEVIYAITSVTPKVTRNYQTKAGSFNYQSIKKDLFSDFLLVDNKFKFFIATPAKALFDLLYFRTNQFRGLKLNEINALIDELRIDIEEMDKMERDKFYSLLEKYI